ncbi:hypothetical protein QBC41DRAFT_396202 [Cercophora samala]|uniref:Nephrocystin 3-like N-terminal domain-containing protein n=1 Tax=Cercophora samala TaxID=330535 RepID=A0AA40DB01_9PEZI|nr:hypothetical protein QBC41DRAFT_396202 [Cercophora samala]
MEVVGLISAIPAPIKLVHQPSTEIHKISSKSRTASIARSLHPQLAILENTLESIQRRAIASSTPTSHHGIDRLVKETQHEITELNRLIDEINGENGGPRFVKRALLVLKGFEKDFKEQAQRTIDRLQISLQTFLSEQQARSKNYHQLTKLLKPSGTVFIPSKVPGTLEWVWSHPEFSHWVSPTDHSNPPSTHSDISHSDISKRTLIIYGVKGSGKSVLAAFIADELQRQGHVKLFFSFWAGAERKRRVEGMLCTLLWQLLGSLPEDERIRQVPQLLSSDISTKSGSLVPEIIRLGQLHHRTVYCVLDGIDESLDDLNDLENGPSVCISRLIEHCTNLRFLLIGRQSSLRTALKKWPHHIELMMFLVRNDVAKLISFEPDNCATITTQELRNQVQLELEVRSTVMFLWIKLVFKELRSSYSAAEIHSNYLAKSP